MERHAVETLRTQMLEVLEAYREEADEDGNIAAREKAQALIEEYGDEMPHLDEKTEDAMQVIEEIATEQAMTVPQQRVIEAIEELGDAMHQEVI